VSVGPPSLPDNTAQLFLLVASIPDASTTQVGGPTVVPIEMEEVVRTLEAISDAGFASPGGPGTGSAVDRVVPS